MSTAAKVTTTIIIIILIILGIWWYKNNQSAIPTPSPTASTTPETQTSQVPVNKGLLTTSANDASDATLQADLNTIDSQATALDEDGKSIDANMTASAVPAY